MQKTRNDTDIPYKTSGYRCRERRNHEAKANLLEHSSLCCLNVRLESLCLRRPAHKENDTRLLQVPAVA